MRLSFHSHKGGQGRSFVAFNVGRALAELGKRVLFIEGDPLGFSSLLGMGREGLIGSIIKGTGVNVLSLNFGSGTMDVLKLFSEDFYINHEFVRLVTDKEIFDKFQEVYSRYISKDYDVCVFDAPKFGLKDVVEAEIRIFSSCHPEERNKVVVVKDYVSPLHEVVSLIRSSVDPEYAELYGLAINMVPPYDVGKAVDELSEAVKKLRFTMGAVVCFSDKYFNLTNPLGVEVPRQLKEMASKVFSNEKVIIY